MPRPKSRKTAESLYEGPATTAQGRSAERFAYQPDTDGEPGSIAVLVDHGNYWFWSWFMRVENEDDARHLVAALNSVCILFDGTAGFPR